MQREESTYMLVFLTLLHSVSSDLEHTCVTSQYNTPYSRVCVVHVVDYVLHSCIPSRQDRPSNQVASDGVFIDVDEANSLLNYPFGSYQSGLPCECCVHRCTVVEFEQYCEPLQRTIPRRRARRSIQKRRNKHFKISDIEDIYNTINISVKRSPATPRSQVSIDEFEQISRIKAWKLKNIENKLLARFGLGDDDTLRLSVNKSSPHTKVANDESLAHASKPKVFSAVNKDSEPNLHHHRHKYLGQR